MCLTISLFRDIVLECGWDKAGLHLPRNGPADFRMNYDVLETPSNLFLKRQGNYPLHSELSQDDAWTPAGLGDHWKGSEVKECDLRHLRVT